MVIGSIAFDKMVDEDDVRTMMGISPEQAAEFMARAAATSRPQLRHRRRHGAWRRPSSAAIAPRGLPVMAQPNAGQPVLEDMKVLYKETPEEMAAGLPGLLAAGAAHRGRLLRQHPHPHPPLPRDPGPPGRGAVTHETCDPGDEARPTPMLPRRQARRLRVGSTTPTSR